MGLAGFAHAILQGCRHQPADGPPPQPRHDAFRLCELARGGQNRRDVQEAPPAFRLGLACIASAQRLRGAEGGVACLSGADAPTVLVDRA